MQRATNVTITAPVALDVGPEGAGWGSVGGEISATFCKRHKPEERAA